MSTLQIQTISIIEVPNLRAISNTDYPGILACICEIQNGWFLQAKHFQEFQVDYLQSNEKGSNARARAPAGLEFSLCKLEGIHTFTVRTQVQLSWTLSVVSTKVQTVGLKCIAYETDITAEKDI
jgi:hypothetical protein